MHLPPADLSPLQAYFQEGHTRSYAFRKKQLVQLKQAIRQYEPRLLEALHQDLHKSAEEAFSTEIGLVYAEIGYLLKHLRTWMQPAGSSSPLALFPSSGKIVREPWGVSLIVAPWNYPFQLLVAPLAGAIAGGNCVVLKPSELAPATAQVMEEMVTAFFDQNYIRVIQGEGAAVAPALLQTWRFDHIFFTGSVPVGKSVALLAAEQLIPVTLELGGKSPCIVDAEVHLKTAAARITWGKFTNAGQTCVAPDYLLVHESRYAALLEEMQQHIRRFYGSDPRQSPDYGRIINQRRFDHLVSFLAQGKVVSGGVTERDSLYISPTIMEQVHPAQPLMQEEVFGPILPVFTYREKEEVLQFISQHSHPLSLYVFSSNKATQQYYTSRLSFGGGCINNTLVHLADPGLPFGGVGSSGMGQYHGRYSFDTFTRPKALLRTGTWIDPAIKYPPYAGKMRWLKWFLK
jgi:aldehyde dehydrogenase (NAD+)